MRRKAQCHLSQVRAGARESSRPAGAVCGSAAVTEVQAGVEGRSHPSLRRLSPPAADNGGVQALPSRRRQPAGRRIGKERRRRGGRGRHGQAGQHQHRPLPSEDPETFPSDAPDPPSRRPTGTPSAVGPFPGVLSPGCHCSNEQSRSQWRAKKYFSSKVSHVSNSLLNNYYVPGISTQINEMLRSPGLPGAHDFIRETGHVLKS